MGRMADTSGRMLELLGLFQARHSWSGGDLAERLGVTERTLRRDVDRLRMQGYPVEAVPGRYGGYRLGRGGTLPPLLLNDDEAVAVAIGLRSVMDGSIAGLEDTAGSVLAKFDQLLPAHLAGRIRAVHDHTSSMARYRPPERIDAGHLSVMAAACSACHRMRFDYTDKGGQPSRRLVEPLGLVRHGVRWYLVARDNDRKDWRTFRLDRIRNPEDIGTTFERRDPPDPVSLVTAGLESMTYPFTARIRVPLAVEDAARMMPRTIAMFASDDGTVIELGSSSMDRMLGYLAGLRPACEVLEPVELRQALADHARKLTRINR
jgi:predicted DNA-binding transcriptional regulator YafY